MQQEQWNRAARYLIGQVAKYLEPGTITPAHMRMTIWSACNNLDSIPIDSEPTAVPFVDVPAPWNRRVI